MIKTAFCRFMAVSCAAFMIMTSAAITAAAANSAYTPEDKDVTTFSDGILTYNVIDDSRFVEVTKCSSSTTNVNIPPKIDGYTVTSIAEGAFSGCTSMQSVTFPKNAELSSIGAYAFAECSALQSVTLPNTVSDIPIGMFSYCTSLESVTFGEGTVSIGDEAFRECSSLKEIELPDSLESMGNFVFYMCQSLENVKLPSGLESIGGYNFTGCVNIKSFNIPSTLIDLGDAPFLGCTGLTDITADENNPSYTVNDGILYSKDKKILYFYPPAREDKTFIVPDGVETIYDGAFFQCVNLQDISFPDNLKNIGAGAFDFCTALSLVTIPESVTNIMSTAFADCTSLTSVTFTGADNETEGSGESLLIGDHAFFACEKLSEVILPKRTDSIGDYAFGVTEIIDDSGNTIPMAVEGFMLRGFDAAERYIKDCDVSVGFSPRSFPWKKIVFWVCAAAALIVIVFFSVMIVKRNMMTAEEKEALRKAKEERASLSSKNAENSEDTDENEEYESILGDDEADNTDDVSSFKRTTQTKLHNIGHNE